MSISDLSKTLRIFPATKNLPAEMSDFPVLERVDRFAGYGDIDFSFRRVAYNINHALETGRVSGGVVMWWRGMSFYNRLKIVLVAHEEQPCSFAAFLFKCYADE